MKIVAVFENGVFRPVEQVSLPDACTVEFEPRLVSSTEGMAAAKKAIYDVLSERFASGESDVATRHNEHQP